MTKAVEFIIITAFDWRRINKNHSAKAENVKCIDVIAEAIFWNVNSYKQGLFYVKAEWKHWYYGKLSEYWVLLRK